MTLTGYKVIMTLSNYRTFSLQTILMIGVANWTIFLLCFLLFMTRDCKLLAQCTSILTKYKWKDSTASSNILESFSDSLYFLHNILNGVSPIRIRRFRFGDYKLILHRLQNHDDFRDSHTEHAFYIIGVIFSSLLQCKLLFGKVSCSFCFHFGDFVLLRTIINLPRIFITRHGDLFCTYTIFIFWLGVKNIYIN